MLVVSAIFNFLATQPDSNDSRSKAGLNKEKKKIMNKGKMDKLNDLKNAYPYFQDAFEKFVYRKLAKGDVDYRKFQLITSDWESVGSQVSVSNDAQGLFAYIARLRDYEDVPKRKRMKTAFRTGGVEIFSDDFENKIHSTANTSRPAGFSGIPKLNPFQTAEKKSASEFLQAFAKLLREEGGDEDSYLRKKMTITWTQSAGTFKTGSLKIQGRIGSLVKIGLRKIIIEHLANGIYNKNKLTGHTVTITLPAARYFETTRLNENKSELKKLIRAVIRKS